MSTILKLRDLLCPNLLALLNRIAQGIERTLKLDTKLYYMTLKTAAFSYY